MRPSHSMIATLLSLGLLTLTTLASIAVAADSQHRRHASRHHPVATAEPQGQIACTPGGCERIPVECTPVPGRTWSGLPTGYDMIVCPPR